MRVGANLLARNTAWNLAGYGIPLVAAAAAIPMAIDGLGVDRFGILALGWVILGYFDLFDLGLTRATTKLVAQSLDAESEQRTGEIVWAAAGLQAALGVFAAVLLAVGASVFADRLLEMPGPLIEEARATFLLLAASVPVVLVTGSFQGALAGAQRFDLINAIRVPSSTSNYLMPLVGLALGWSLPGIVALLGGVRVAVLVAYVVLCGRVFPAVLTPALGRWRTMRRLLSFGVWVTISGVVGPILIYLDRFIIGGMLSVGAAGFYAAPFELVMRLMILPGALAGTLFPALSTLMAQGDRSLAGVTAARSTKYLAMASGSCSVVLIVYAPQILGLVLGAAFVDEGSTVFRILAAGVLVNSFAHVPYATLHAHGRPDVPAKFHLLQLPVHVILVFVLVARWGIVGAAAAWTTRVTLDAVLLFTAAARVSPLSGGSLRNAKLPEVLITLVVLSLALGVAHRAIGDPLTNVLMGGALMSLAMVAMVRLGLDEHEQAFFRRWLHRRWERR